MKRIFALLLAVMLCIGVALPAYADNGTGTGTITVTNAEQGQTYYVVKAFDAQVDVIEETTNISYTLNANQNQALYNLIKNDTTLPATGSNPAIECPFVVHATAESGIYSVTHKVPQEGQSNEFGRGWLYGWYGKTGGWNLAPSASAALGDSEYNTLNFTNLPYGYYMIYKQETGGTTKGAIASVVNLTSSSAAIADKNPRSPGDPDKKVKVGTGYAENAQAQVGDVVSYQASFMATNYRTYENPMSTKQITSYTVRDDAKGLKYKSLDRMAIYRTKNSDGTFSGLVKEWTWDYPNTVAPYKTDPTFGGYSMEIKWVDNEGKSLYPSPCYVVLEYQMYVTEAALNNTYNNTATNTFSPSFVIGDTTTPIENPPSVEVRTSGLSIAKTDKNGHPLEGAQFILSTIVDGNERFYHVDTQESPITHETWKDVNWVEKSQLVKETDYKTAGNNPDEQTFGGLKEGTYRLYEVETPDGFQFPGFEYWEIVITYNSTSNSFSGKIRPAGTEAYTNLPLATTSTGASRYYFLTTIVNEGGSPLPQTGAAGTTMLLLVGGTMFAVTMLFLVTKKRLYNEG